MTGIDRSPSGNIDKYVKRCEQIIKIIYKLPKGRRAEIMLLEDVNIDLLLSSKCMVMGKITKFCNDFFLRQYVKEATRLKSMLIDHFYTNSHNIFSCTPLPINVSDHLPIGIIRKKKGNTHTHTEFSGRSYLRYTREVFKNLLIDHDWNLFYSLTNVKPTKKEPMDVQSGRSINRSLGFLAKILDMFNLFGRPIRGLFGRPHKSF